jgi:hypothetical protein
VGSPYTISCTGGDAGGNYSVDDSATAHLTVGKATLTVTPDAQSMTYGGSVPSFTFQVAGFVGSDGWTTQPTCSAGAGPFTHVGSPYTISCTGGDAGGNYSVDDSATAHLTVGKAHLIVTADNKSMILNGAIPTLTSTITGFVNGETLATSGVAGAASCTTSATGHLVGSFPISCTVGTLTASNYDFATFNPGTLTVGYSLCLLYDNTKSFKAGSTAPLKLYLCDANSADVSSSGITVNATSLQKKDSQAAPQTVTDTGNANPDGNFRFDSTLGSSGGYIFNLSTKSPSPALGQGTTALSTGTWILSLTIGGVGGYSIQFDVK